MDENVVLILYDLKLKIKQLNESNKHELIPYIKANFLRMLEILKIFLISNRNAYYGYYLMNMTFQADFSSSSIAGILLNTYPPVFSSNPLKLCKFSIKEIIFIMCHEIDHVVFNHPAEMIKCNPNQDEELFTKFNYAADAAVNDNINKEIREQSINYMAPPSGIITSTALAKMFNLSHVLKEQNYLYYFNLIKDIDLHLPPSPMQNAFNKVNNNKKSTKNGDSNGFTIGESNGSDSSNSSDGLLTDHQWDAGDDYYEAQANVTHFLNSTEKMITGSGRGLLPAFYETAIEFANTPPVITWQKILKKYAGTVVAGHKKSRSRLNRRQPLRFDLSGEVPDKVLKIVVAIDTSGSMLDSTISKIFSEIFAILSQKHFELTVIECDARINKVYKVRSRADISPKVSGRGGTSFVPVIEYLNGNKYYRDALLIYFTDGYGDKKIPKPLTYRNIWVLTEDGDLSVENPYGIVLKM